MDRNAMHEGDELVVQALRRGCSRRIGLPTGIVTHVLTRPDYPHSPASILGVKEVEDDDPENAPIDLLGEYSNMFGYMFSWGSVSEATVPADGDEFEEDFIYFEILPEQLLGMHPYPAYWEDLMIGLYQDHPLRSAEFNADDASGTFHTLMFAARGHAEKVLAILAGSRPCRVLDLPTLAPFV